MKFTVCIFLSALLGGSLFPVAHAAEPDLNNPSTPTQDTEAHIQDLQQALSEAKARVSDLEAELNDAQMTIRQLKDQDANQVADTTGLNDAEETTHAVDQTVHGHPVYDANNPKRPIEQRNVISEKFTPDVQNQPIAITRLIDDDIERGGIRHLDRVAPLVPNMQYGQSGNEARVAIRGARTNRTGAEAEQAVAIFEDGVSVPTTTQAMGPYVDIKSIEVLRGPQGTLYGRNAFGGVINVTSNKPNLKGWEAVVEGTIGYADGTRFEAMLNIPILDTLATRVAARSDVHSGYVNNHTLEGDADDLHDRKQQFVRWMTTWQPSDKFSLAVNIASLDQNQTGSGMWGYQQIGALVDGEYLSGHQFAPDNAQADKGPRNLRRNMASLEDQENLSGTLKMDWDIGFANMQWYINKSKFENQQVFDSDYSDGGDIYNSDFNGWDSLRDTLSSELRLISNSTGRFDWQAGLYWFDMESNWGWLETNDGIHSQPEWDSTGNYQTDSKAAFASAGLNIDENLRLVGGLRWYDDSKQLRTGSTDSWSGVLWNAGLEYNFSENIYSYVSASTGYKPGGLNETPGVPMSFDSENVTAFEIGLKNILADGTFVLNLSAFYNDYTDMQAQSFTVLPFPGSAGLMDYMTTAGDMESKGLEVEIQWLPGSRWNISANLAWLDAKFTDYEVPAIAGLGDIEGHTMGDRLSLNGWRPPLSPEWSFGLQASYIISMGHGGTFTPMIQTSYVGDHFTNDLNIAGARQGSFSKTDARFFWDLPGNKLRFQFYVENIEETKTVNNVMIYNPEERPGIATFLANWDDPMTYGIILSYRY